MGHRQTSLAIPWVEFLVHQALGSRAILLGEDLADDKDMQKSKSQLDSSRHEQLESPSPVKSIWWTFSDLLFAGTYINHLLVAMCRNKYVDNKHKGQQSSQNCLMQSPK